MNSRVKIKKSERENMKEKIKKYFSEEMDENLGDLASELVLDFFLKELSPDIYNQGIEDAHTYMLGNMEDLQALKIIRR